MDQAAFRIFYAKTAPASRAYAIRSCGSMDVADDLVQESFLRFLRSAPAGSLNEARMRGYLYRTLERLMVDRWRRMQRERQLESETTPVPPPDEYGPPENGYVGTEWYDGPRAGIADHQ